MKKVIIASLFFFARPAYADEWNFPLTLNDENTTIRFEVDSTWHMVEGKTAGVKGSIALKDPADASSVHGQIAVPVAKFDTDSARRDAEMRDVMAESEYRDVVYNITSAGVECATALPLEARSCNVILHGDLSIRGVSRPWDLPAHVDGDPAGYHLRGEGKLRWPDFGVKDPSIFIAKLHPEVKVIVDVYWKH